MHRFVLSEATASTQSRGKRLIAGSERLPLRSDSSKRSSEFLEHRLLSVMYTAQAQQVLKAAEFARLDVLARSLCAPECHERASLDLERARGGRELNANVVRDSVPLTTGRLFTAVATGRAERHRQAAPGLAAVERGLVVVRHGAADW